MRLLGQRRWQDSTSWYVRHSLGLILTVLLVAQSMAFHFTLLPEWTSMRTIHGQSTALWPAYWLYFVNRWLVNVMGGTYGALALVLLTKVFYEAGSTEAKDPPGGS